MQEVRRSDDDELCGYVTEVAAGSWQALTVFRGVLGEHGDEDEARRHVLNDGLTSVAERWTLVDSGNGNGDGGATEQIVCIQQMSPDEITLALDYYSLPGVPTLTLATDELAGGRWRLERRT